MTDALRFDRFEVRLAERRLLVDGEPAALGVRAFDLLLALIERRDRVVRKTELFDIVWGGVPVEENNMSVQISALRKLLGTHAIATVPGRGYRFALPLLEDMAAARAQPPAALAPAATAQDHSLPLAAATMLGRHYEQAALDSQLRHHRLVTLVGPAGIGKTMLALAAARQRREALRDGAFWVDLAATTDASHVPRLVARALSMPAVGDERELDHLVGQLRAMQLLLVLDNAEHLVDSVAALAHALVQSATGVHLLVTSQVRLRVEGERVFRLGALSVPETGATPEDALLHGAVALFVDQAQAVDQRFALTEANAAAVIEACRQLDGVPLAIKLAAARLPLFGVQGLAARLSERLQWRGASARSAAPRQRTLLAALDWSHGLLSPAEQAVFRRLGVCAGGFPLPLAVGVAADQALGEQAVIDALEGLIDRSIVQADAGDLPRYRLLESARDFALGKLQSAGEAAALRAKHARAVLALFESAGKDYWSTPEAPWLARYGPDLENARAALDWACTHDTPLAVALLGASGELFTAVALPHEWRQRCLALGSFSSSDIEPAALARFWFHQAVFSFGNDEGLARGLALKSLDLCRAIGDATGAYVALGAAISGSGSAEGGQLIEEMHRLERPEWPPRLRRMGQLARAVLMTRAGRHVEACAAFRATLALSIEAGASSSVSFDRGNLAYACLEMGDFGQAVTTAQELLAGPHSPRGRPRLYALGYLAHGLLMLGRVAEARDTLTELLDVCADRAWDCLGYFSDQCSLLAAAEGRLDAAAHLIGYADKAYEAIGKRYPSSVAARQRAWAAVSQGLDSPAIAQRLAAGAQMDPQTVCGLTLGATQGAP